MSNRLEQRVLAKTASYTLIPPHDSPGTRFTNRGAVGSVTFTLPIPNLNVKGHWYVFEVHADQTVIVAGHANGKIVAIGNAAANNVSYAVSGKKVGRRILVACDGTQWLAWGSGDGFCVNGSEIAVAHASVNATNVDAGASGTAGTVDIFPSTAAKGKLAMSVTDQVGDTIVSYIVGAMAAARVITLADPLGDADILTGKMGAVARTATAAGLTTGTIADAGLLQFVQVTVADANHIIILPTPTPGRIVILNNGATGYELRSSAPATVAINGGAEADAESAIAANSTVIAICISATAWKAIFLDADGDVAKVAAAAAA
jgi:hypothetical protein